jgi:hypothetical protein
LAKIGCFASVPVAEVVRLRSGGTATVCTRGDGGLSGWRSPVYPSGSRVGAALAEPVARLASDPVRIADAGYATVPTPGRTRVSEVAATPPQGYRLAWTDDRLNPQRGRGTQAGWVAQDQTWTRDVPSGLVADQPRRKARVVVSTKTAPAAVQPSVSRGALVQVGTFGVPANAENAAARLASLGLPVARGRTAKAGKTLQIVFAGPFGSAAEAQAALAAARRAGFSDAFLR